MHLFSKETFKKCTKIYVKKCLAKSYKYHQGHLWITGAYEVSSCPHLEPWCSFGGGVHGKMLIYSFILTCEFRNLGACRATVVGNQRNQIIQSKISDLKLHSVQLCKDLSSVGNGAKLSHCPGGAWLHSAGGQRKISQRGQVRGKAKGGEEWWEGGGRERPQHSPSFLRSKALICWAPEVRSRHK